MAKAKISQSLRERVAQRAGLLCEYCRSQERFAPQPFTIDHITPESKGGSQNFENLAYACQGCNIGKASNIGTIDPLTGDFCSYFNPRTQVWEEHFAWDAQCVHVVGLSPIGRVTVVGLGLNRKILVELRGFLRKHGEHPPTSV
jgi:hypothetical protein